MAKALKEKEILENLKMLADWIRVKHPGDYFELVVVGGAAMALEGFKNQTMDIDVIRPEVLPEPIVNGVANIGKIRRLGSGWLNSNVANMLLKTKGLAVMNISMRSPALLKWARILESALSAGKL